MDLVISSGNVGIGIAALISLFLSALCGVCVGVKKYDYSTTDGADFLCSWFGIAGIFTFIIFFIFLFIETCLM